jgi:hypothetical protein
MAEKQQATATSVKVSKNARTAGSKTQKFLHSCGGQINMVLLSENGKKRMKAVCEKCGTEGRRPSLMDLFVEKVEIKKEYQEE